MISPHLKNKKFSTPFLVSFLYFIKNKIVKRKMINQFFLFGSFNYIINQYTSNSTNKTPNGNKIAR